MVLLASWRFTPRGGVAVPVPARPQRDDEQRKGGELGADEPIGERAVASGTWDALKFDHDQPFPKDAKGKVAAFPLKGEHLISS